MSQSIAYKKAIALLHKATSNNGFLASAENITNYHRVWARDGVICGLAALLDGNQKLVQTFKETLQTLRTHQHEIGNIPSNVAFEDKKPSVSFGGLAGRVDTISWFIIGVFNYVNFTNDTAFLTKNKKATEKGFLLLESWEFNTSDLIYVPRSGNWADEYITEGHILYDQLLRLWALRCYQKWFPDKQIGDKIARVTKKLQQNFRKKKDSETPYHPKAYENLKDTSYWQTSVSPSGYQTQYDGFANALAILLRIDKEYDAKVIDYSEKLRNILPLRLLPAFWPAIQQKDWDWKLLENNCKYEFRNHPYEFHNGGTWQLVNGFYAAALAKNGHKKLAQQVLEKLHECNAVEDWSFYECFNSKTKAPVGVKNCTWSAAAAIIAKQYIKGKELVV